MDSKTSLFAALTLVVAVSCVTPETSTATQNFEENIENAKKAVQNITQALGLPDLPNHNEIIQTFKETSKALNNKLQDFLTKLQEGDAKEGFIQSAITNLNQTVNSIHSVDLKKNTEDFKNVVSQTYRTIVNEIEKVTKEVNKQAQPNGPLHEAATDALKKFVDIAKDVEKKVQEASATKKQE
ncbi:uncharacterized protein LOC142323100 [Lycorma delicatula]|uniref:uncharacterized protein LOC142323100 n=1 Tax=Lycorma delicatula TaxID=130591 RepID=UPI003F518996